MEQAAGLLHKAKKASGDEKASLLERLLTLVKGITAAPTFLDELLPLVLELHDEDSRAFVAQVGPTQRSSSSIVGRQFEFGADRGGGRQPPVLHWAGR